MSFITLIHPEEQRQVSTHNILAKSVLFQNDPSLASSPYRVRSFVSVTNFRSIVSEFDGHSVDITDHNFSGLLRLSEEFGFESLIAKLSQFRATSPSPSPLSPLRHSLPDDTFSFIANGTVVASDLPAASCLSPLVRDQLCVDSCARTFTLNGGGLRASDVRSLHFLLAGEGVSARRSLGVLSRALGNADFERLFVCSPRAGMRMTLRDLLLRPRLDLESAGLAGLSADALDALLLSDAIAVGSEDALLRFIVMRGPEYLALLRHVRVAFLAPEGLALLRERVARPPEALWREAARAVGRIDSRIVGEFPEILGEFRGRTFALLWRGSGDGFRAKWFHRRCDGHADTLTLIGDAKGNIFGGFTPIGWGEREGDESGRSFLFSLRNPHNFAPRKFRMRGGAGSRAILCDEGWGPHFWDLGVGDKCDRKARSFTSLGKSYVNDTGLDGGVVFTGEENFQVKEIEVFEIRD